MSGDDSISFGDRVRVRSTEITVERGIAGLVGQVYGQTTPSVTGVEVIGETKSDHAINVDFEGLGAEYWFAPELLEFVDHAPGTTIDIGGKKRVRTADGNWSEELRIPPDTDVV